jgi:hypothetical protein
MSFNPANSSGPLTYLVGSFYNRLTGTPRDAVGMNKLGEIGKKVVKGAFKPRRYGPKGVRVGEGKGRGEKVERRSEGMWGDWVAGLWEGGGGVTMENEIAGEAGNYEEGVWVELGSFEVGDVEPITDEGKEYILRSKKAYSVEPTEVLPIHTLVHPDGATTAQDQKEEGKSCTMRICPRQT